MIPNSFIVVVAIHGVPIFWSLPTDIDSADDLFHKKYIEYKDLLSDVLHISNGVLEALPYSGDYTHGSKLKKGELINKFIKDLKGETRVMYNLMIDHENYIKSKSSGYMVILRHSTKM